MISEKTFTEDWIKDRSNHFKNGSRKADVELIEKVLCALYLLENLVVSELTFIFKGGTSLLLLLDKIHRFSIDIDIIIETNDKKLNSKFDKLVESNTIFTRFEEITRQTKTGISKAHYKFYYQSILDNREKYILLDILFETNHYDEIIERQLTSDFLINEGEPVTVKVPSANCILGDKLTAFAPNTTGIPYDQSKELEIIKQLFDVSNLFDNCNDLEVTKNTFIRIAEQELIYRNMSNTSFIDVLDDIFNTSTIIAFRGSRDREIFTKLESGIKRIKSYIFSGNFNIEEAVLCSSKAAYLSLLIKNNINSIEFFNPKLDLTDLVITHQEYKKNFKTIKKISIEAYYYWYKAIELYQIVEAEVEVTG